MKVMGVDPGGTTGFALLDGPKVVEVGEVESKDFKEWLAESVPSDIDFLVVEDYRLRPDKMTKANHAWSSAQTVRLIGALDFWAHLNSVAFKLQQASIKTAGSAWTGLPYTPGHPIKNQHAIDATIHAAYFLIHNKHVTLAQFKGLT